MNLGINELLRNPTAAGVLRLLRWAAEARVGGLTVPQLAQTLERSQGVVRTSCRELRLVGLVVKNGRRGRSRVWNLPQDAAMCGLWTPE